MVHEVINHQSTSYLDFYSISTWQISLCLYVLNPLMTVLSVVMATLSQWPHQRTTQRNRNDRLFIIAQPLCWRGKSIIKTRLTAKITAVSSIVLEHANFFFSSRVSWPVQHHLGAICSPSQIPLPFGIGFTWVIHTVNGLSFQWKKKKKFCVKLPEESGGFGFVGTSLCLPLTFQQEECPHYTEGLGASCGCRRKWKQGNKNGNVYNVLKVEAHFSCNFIAIIC